jgi:methylmalonyl-CoA mutase N-terminal domain/subunit
VIAHESGVADLADPLGGSYAIEHLTDEIEDRASNYIERIDALGGMLRAIETGYVQKEIQESAYRYQRAIEDEESIVVGVNRFQNEAETAIPTLRVDPVIEQQQIERLRAVRSSRDAATTETALARLESAARGTENLLPRILACVEVQATVGEISNRFRNVWGEYQETSTV